MKPLAIAAGMLMLMGCGQPELVWVHPDRANHDFMQDRDACNRRIDSLDANYKTLFDRCMKDFGWQQQEID